MRAVTALALVLATLAVAGASPAATSGLQLTPVGRLPFPERGYVIDLSGRATVDPDSVRVRENGRTVRDVEVSPVAAAGIHFGVVLAIDASESMTGGPLAAAVDAARTFVAQRESDQQVGVVAFNGDVRVVQEPTKTSAELESALARAPELAYGTRIFDAVDESLALLARARLSSGSIVLLSDGADIGSRTDIERVIAKARAGHVRIFAVGLRSGAFDSTQLRRLAESTGGTFAEASSARRLSAIYDALGRRLASEYVVRYRSDAAPRSQVDVSITFRGLGNASTRYVAPTPAGLEPYHRSLAARVVASPAAPFVLSLLIAGFAALAVVIFARPRRSTLVERVRDFAGHDGYHLAQEARTGVAATRRRVERGALGKLERTLEIGRIEMSAARLVLLTMVGTALTVFVLALFSPVFAVLGLLSPLLSRAFVVRKLRAVRDEFADQLAPNLQVLASALRTGHSFIGALTVVVDNAHEPSQSELRRTLADEQLGVPVEEAIKRVADRMKSRDLEQVALLAELQRTAGGNAAEVLDTVVETLRERADIRRLVRTLTAQGRMARWILSSLPIAAGLMLWALQPNAIVPLFESSTGQVLLVIAAVLVVIGSLIIQKIVDIKV
jgi:tight adherence protein B